MEAKLACLTGILMLVILVSGCIGGDPNQVTDTTGDQGGVCNAPKKMIGNICCYDENDNGVCDIEDVGCPSSCDDDNPCTTDSCSADTDFKCVHEAEAPCCGNGDCEPNEEHANICPEDCTVIDISEFAYMGTPDYMDGSKFVFIHTGSSETEQRMFYLNISAGPEGMENIRYTFECNSSQHEELDSINSEPDNVTDELDIKINKLDEENYLVYTNFFLHRSPTYSRDIDELEGNEDASFHFSIKKKFPQKRDELTCLVKLYFMSPRKIIHRWLEISYI